MDGGGNLLEEALQIAKERGYAEISLETDDLSFSATLTVPKKKPGSKPLQDSSQEEIGPEELVVKSHLVGYFQAPNSGIKVGSKVQEKDVIAVISVFGISNEIEAGASAMIKEILVEDGQAVEYGQPLLILQMETTL